MANKAKQTRRRKKKATKQRKRYLKRASRLKRLVSRLDARIQKIRKRRDNLDRTVGLDGTPLSLGLKLVLLDARAHGWPGVLVSGDRREGVAEKYGKSSQAKLYRCYQNCTGDCPSCNPANPPGRSTHELRSDGVAYPGPVGRRLGWSQLGLDVSYAVELLSVLSELGYDFKRPYSDPREAHHLNCYTNPRKRLIARGRV